MSTDIQHGSAASGGGSGPGGAAADAASTEALARDLVARLVERSLTVATCESLTGGGVCAALTSVPGSSRVVRGGLVTYASDLKVRLAGVDADWVREHGVINETTAVEMALGALRACGALVAVSCTGVAGPDGQDGHGSGEVWLAVAMEGEPETSIVTRHLHLAGDRDAVRAQTVAAALHLLLDQMR